MKVKPYPRGTKVRINHFEEVPEGWNTYMFHELMGKTSVIAYAPKDSQIDDREFYYKLVGWDWNWRHRDLCPLDKIANDPNLAFRMRKHGIR